jgi:DNA-binding transcriptional LysR family regulator
VPIDGSEYVPGVRVLRLADADAYRDVGMIWNSDRPLSRSARDFIAAAAAVEQRRTKNPVS